MPSVKRSRVAGNASAVLIENQSGPSGPHEPFDPFDPSIEFLDAVRWMTVQEWRTCVLYIYRVVPEVRNKSGQEKYISRITEPVEPTLEDWIALEHGGGKYQLILKDDSNRNDVKTRTFIFGVDGPAKLIDGQTLRDRGQEAGAGGAVPISSAGVTLPPSPPSRGSEYQGIVDVIKEINRSPSQEEGAKVGIEIMKQGFETALDVVKKQSSTVSGNPLLDKILENLIQKSLGDGNSQKSADILRLELEIERLKANPPAGAGADPLGQLSAVKDLLGVDSVADLIRPSAEGEAWKTKLIEMGAGLIASLPALAQQFFANQEREFQRRIYLEQVRRQQPAAAIQLGPQIVPPLAAPVVAGVAPEAPNMNEQPAGVMMPFDPMQSALEDIVLLFEEGADGATVAHFLANKYPALVAVMRPQFSNLEVVKGFAANTPPLNAIAVDGDFPKFLEEFAREIGEPPQPGPEIIA